MPKLDIPVKRLMERRAADWVRLVYPAAGDIRPLNRELTPKVQSRLDALFQVTTPQVFPWCILRRKGIGIRRFRRGCCAIAPIFGAYACKRAGGAAHSPDSRVLFAGT